MAILLAFCLLPLFAPSTLAAESSAPASTSALAATSSVKEQREIEKLELEIKQLASPAAEVLRWFGALSPLAVAVLVAYLGYSFNRRLSALQNTQTERQAAENRRDAHVKTVEEREDSRFAALIEDRARAYALAFEKLKPAALFFPPSSAGQGVRDKNSPRFNRADCQQMGEGLSDWYFGPGGLLMTTDSRNAYFTLMEALRRAVLAPNELTTQTVGDHGNVISEKLVRAYRKELAAQYPVFRELEDKRADQRIDVGKWQFGAAPSSSSGAESFKDYVLIQTLASRFRTTLTDDIRSRKAPDGPSEPDTP